MRVYHNPPTASERVAMAGDAVALGARATSLRIVSIILGIIGVCIIPITGLLALLGRATHIRALYHPYILNFLIIRHAVT